MLYKWKNPQTPDNHYNRTLTGGKLQTQTSPVVTIVTIVRYLRIVTIVRPDNRYNPTGPTGNPNRLSGMFRLYRL